MTENKRFEICGEGSTNIDVTTYIVEYGDGDDDCFELYESKEDSQKVCDKINNILDENEELKNELRVYRKLANCGNCQYHDYDTLFGGDEEYEVCDKGNDITEGICKDWREL